MLIFRFNRTHGRFEITGIAGKVEQHEHHGFRPPVDISLSNRVFYVRLDLPGVLPEHISVEAGETYLAVTGTIRADEPPGPCRLIERHSGTFMRKLNFPVKITPDKVEARLENGVLSLKIPSPSAVRASTVIEIRVEGAD
jgi:HSP20 family protein